MRQVESRPGLCGRRGEKVSETDGGDRTTGSTPPSPLKGTECFEGATGSGSKGFAVGFGNRSFGWLSTDGRRVEAECRVEPRCTIGLTATQTPPKGRPNQSGRERVRKKTLAPPLAVITNYYHFQKVLLYKVLV